MSGAPRPNALQRFAYNLRSRFNAIAFGQALPPWDDTWYTRPGWDSSAGMSVTPESAMQLSAVFSCVRVISETIGSLPFIIYKRLPNGGKERATDHPLYKVLHDRPNIWQTSMEFFEMMQGHVELRGNAFAHIVPGDSGAVDQLVPLHPDLVQVYRLPNGKLKYQVRSRFTAEVDWYMQDEIFHLRGMSSDGLVGLSPIAIQRETVGTGLAMQDYAGRFFANDSTPSGVLKHPGKFKDDEARRKFADSWQTAQTREGRHRVAILEAGLDYKQIGITNKESQFLEASGATDIKICGIFRLQPHKIGLLDRTTHSNIEQQSIEFVTDTLRPRVVRWERRINLDLIDPVSEALGDGDDEYFGEFLVDGLLRGDLKSRYDSYNVGRQGGWLCPNDICRMENLNPIPPEKGGDDYMRPVNYVVPGDEPVPGAIAPPGGAPPVIEPDKNTPDDTGPDSPPPDIPDDEGQDARAKHDRRMLVMLATEAAGRVVRKEVTVLRKALSAPESFDEKAEAFYSEHAALVARTMCISDHASERYVYGHLEMLREAAEPDDKASVLDWIEDISAEDLAHRAVGFTRRRYEKRGAKKP